VNLQSYDFFGSERKTNPTPNITIKAEEYLEFMDIIFHMEPVQAAKKGFIASTI
jgi:hypothetical protein